MIHSGSRAMGQAIAARHLIGGIQGRMRLLALDATRGPGQSYLSDAEWARRYAAENRLAMLTAVEGLLGRLFGTTADWNSLIHTDHNHVVRYVDAGRSWWVHRKGAQSAGTDEEGVVPGSMGAPSFHTLGRGCAEALASCSHGAGRRLSRSEARRAVSGKAFARQVGRLWYDHRRVARLLDEAPAVYKDVREVIRAQRELIKVVRQLRPLLSYKGT
jgi:tRNA-splicing ligase RtcB